jgi:exopolysaccharide biosynthesis WecB/TagA/CpsF family protein
VKVSVTSYQEVVRAVIWAATNGDRGIATFMPVHGIVTGVTDREFRKRLNECDIVAPDGQPVRWALNHFHNAELDDRVYGPETMRRVCLRAAQSGIGIFLCGSTPEVLEKLSAKLLEWFPTLKILGTDSPPFRPMTPSENDALCQRINDSGAKIVFIGMGCPRQEIFAHANRDKINAVQLCVGAAFDFHAGQKKMAPAFFQNHGLEWLFRLFQEPGRLWKRYLVTNSIFVSLVALHSIIAAAKALWGEPVGRPAREQEL